MTVLDRYQCHDIHARRDEGSLQCQITKGISIISKITAIAGRRSLYVHTISIWKFHIDTNLLNYVEFIYNYKPFRILFLWIKSKKLLHSCNLYKKVQAQIIRRIPHVLWWINNCNTAAHVARSYNCSSYVAERKKKHKTCQMDHVREITTRWSKVKLSRSV